VTITAAVNNMSPQTPFPSSVWAYVLTTLGRGSTPGAGHVAIMIP
jgi:hypothetical protein